MQIIKILSVPREKQQIVIYRTATGNFSFAKRWWVDEIGAYGELGPACGIYDTPVAAEKEARSRIEGLETFEESDSIH